MLHISCQKLGETVKRLNEELVEVRRSREELIERERDQLQKEMTQLKAQLSEVENVTLLHSRYFLNFLLYMSRSSSACHCS